MCAHKSTHESIQTSSTLNSGIATAGWVGMIMTAAMSPTKDFSSGLFDWEIAIFIIMLLLEGTNQRSPVPLASYFYGNIHSVWSLRLKTKLRIMNWYFLHSCILTTPTHFLLILLCLIHAFLMLLPLCRVTKLCVHTINEYSHSL